MEAWGVGEQRKGGDALPRGKGRGPEALFLCLKSTYLVCCNKSIKSLAAENNTRGREREARRGKERQREKEEAREERSGAEAFIETRVRRNRTSGSLNPYGFEVRNPNHRISVPLVCVCVCVFASVSWSSPRGVLRRPQAKKTWALRPPKPVSKQLKEGPFAFFRVLLVRPQSTTALIESAEERRFHKTDETSRTLEEFAFGFEGEIRKTIDFFLSLDERKRPPSWSL